MDFSEQSAFHFACNRGLATIRATLGHPVRSWIPETSQAPRARADRPAVPRSTTSYSRAHWGGVISSGDEVHHRLGSGLPVWRRPASRSSTNHHPATARRKALRTIASPALRRTKSTTRAVQLHEGVRVVNAAFIHRSAVPARRGHQPTIWFRSGFVAAGRSFRAPT